jgi:hypothetical protein
MFALLIQTRIVVLVYVKCSYSLVKSFVSVFLLLFRGTVITGKGYFALNTNSKCPTPHEVKRGRECTPNKMSRDQTAQGLYFDMLSLELLDSIVNPII